MENIKGFYLPPHRIMYTSPRKKEKKVLFSHLKDSALFQHYSEEEKKALRRCKIEFAFENELDAVRASLGNKVKHLTDEEIKRRFPHYKKYAFPLRTTTYLVMTKKDNQFILIDHVLHRSADLYKRCTLCGDVTSVDHFKSGGKCNVCLNRIKADKRAVRNTILNYVNNEENLVPLFGKHTWKIEVSQDIIEKLEKEGIVAQEENEAYMLYDVHDLQKENIDLEQLLVSQQ